MRLAERRILGVLPRERPADFQAIVDALPEYQWATLLTALLRMQERGRIELVPNRTTIEITRRALCDVRDAAGYSSSMPSAICRVRSARLTERGA